MLPPLRGGNRFWLTLERSVIYMPEVSIKQIKDAINEYKEHKDEQESDDE